MVSGCGTVEASVCGTVEASGCGTDEASGCGTVEGSGCATVEARGGIDLLSVGDRESYSLKLCAVVFMKCNKIWTVFRGRY